MLQRYQGIVLCSFKYNDTKNIAHIFTRENGRMSFLIPVSRSKKKGAMSLLFQPLAMVEIDAEVRPRASLHPVREARLWHVLSSLPYDPYKSGIAMFLSEFLFRALKEEGRDEALFSYLAGSIMWLDACEKSFSNFHLVFLIRLSRFLGLYPNTEDYAEGAYFDLMNACFTIEKPFHGMFLHPEESARIVNLMRMKYDNMHLFAMNRMERNRCLDIINEYYRLHLPDFPELKSLSVLQELFI